MTYEKFPDQTGQNFPVSPQYATFPGSSVNAFESPQYATFPESGAAPPDTPLTILGANTLVWLRSDLGVTEAGTVSAWADQSGNGHDFAQGTGANQPAYNAAGGPNGTPSVLFDGVNDVLVNATLDLPAPGTTPTFIWLVFRQITWTVNDRLFGAGSATQNEIILFCNGVTPQLRSFNGTNGPLNGGATLTTWVRGEAYFSNTVGDYTKFAATSVTGSNAGNTDPGVGFKLGASGILSGPSNIEVCEFVIANALPSAGQLTQLDAYTTGRYGAGLV